MLHGVTSFQLDATPTCALPQSASVMPIARSIARAGARSMPSVTSWLRGFMSVIVAPTRRRSRRAVGVAAHCEPPWTGRVASPRMATPLDIGIIGAGPWAKMMTGPVLAAGPQTRVTGVWSRTGSHASELAEQLSAPAFDTVDALLDACDAIAICVAPAAQPELRGPRGACGQGPTAGETARRRRCRRVGGRRCGAPERCGRARVAVEPLQSRPRHLLQEVCRRRTARRTGRVRLVGVPRRPVRVRLAIGARRRARHRSASPRLARGRARADRACRRARRCARLGLRDLRTRKRRDEQRVDVLQRRARWRNQRRDLRIQRHRDL